jgi:hypothetical protein
MWNKSGVEGFLACLAVMVVIAIVGMFATR